MLLGQHLGEVDLWEHAQLHQCVAEASTVLLLFLEGPGELVARDQALADEQFTETILSELRCCHVPCFRLRKSASSPSRSNGDRNQSFGKDAKNMKAHLDQARLHPSDDRRAEPPRPGTAPDRGRDVPGPRVV